MNRKEKHGGRYFERKLTNVTVHRVAGATYINHAYSG